MSAAATAATTGPPGAGRRLVGVDVARALALLAMMATHVLPLERDGAPTLTELVASGRASATFAVLAGVGLALLTGGPRPPEGPELSAARRGVLGRAAVIAGIGLVLGLVPSGLAVILVNYGALFAVAALFLGLRARALVPMALTWLVLAPVVSHLLRPLAPGGPGAVPSLLSVLTPVRAVVELLLTGYYPVLTWTGYLLVGMAVARLDLRRTAVAVGALGVGAGLALAAWGVSAPLVATAGGVGAVQATYYGTAPTTSWAWLAVFAPHSGSAVDLVHTAGCALAVLGACLLLTRWRALAALALPLAAAGSMTLTLYSVHVVLRAPMQLLLPPTASYLVQVLVLVGAATVWRLTADRGAVPRRGPLEQLAHAGAGAARGPHR